MHCVALANGNIWDKVKLVREEDRKEKEEEEDMEEKKVLSGDL